MRKTLVTCESPVAHNDTWVEWCMHPFLAGLCERFQTRHLYRTFTQKEELHSLLSEQLPRPRDGHRVIAYVSSHGYSSSLSAVVGKSISLQPLAQKASRDVEGYWLSACLAGGSEALFDFVRNGGCAWVGGYKCEVDWDAAMLIDLAVLQEALTSKPPQTKEMVVDLFRRALERFSKDWEIGGPDDERVTLAAAIRVVGRSMSSGPTAADLTDRVLAELGWGEVLEPTGS